MVRQMASDNQFQRMLQDVFITIGSGISHFKSTFKKSLTSVINSNDLCHKQKAEKAITCSFYFL